MGRGVLVGAIIFVLLGGTALPLQAQQPAPDREQERGFRLDQNYPNPFNPTTRIPFFLDEDLFQDGRPVVVSVRIFNILQQLVAVPVALDHTEGNRVPVEGLEYSTPGRKEAFWDGLDQFGRAVASGIYYLQLLVNGRSHVRKMVVSK
jgi:hypothetical protein